MTNRTLRELADAFSNVLRRKRAERLLLEQQLAAYAKRRETPPRELGYEYSSLGQQIRTLEAAIDAAMHETKQP